MSIPSITPIQIEEELRKSYVDYAMSVIVSRALPDVRDGLKPVHRRILYAMWDKGYTSDAAHKKVARIVGDVMGQFHPHGDTAIADALVRMGQPWSLRLPLIDGQGNFGSVDGDNPAAMRYIEARLAPAAEPLLEDLSFDTVAFTPNYDESLQEPSVLPARYPHLLVNGSGGIAVGMATAIPTHNLGEVIDATLLLLKSPQATAQALMKHLPGPDFPTGGSIVNTADLERIFATGRGAVILRGRIALEEIRRGRKALVITEIPFQVKKKALIEKIAELVREKKIEGITDVRDESSREGMRIVLDLRPAVVVERIITQLLKDTPLQTSVGVNLLALSNGRPEVLSVRDVLMAFLEFRREVVTRRTRFSLDKALDKAHVQTGLVVAAANLDRVVKLIREAADPAAAREALMAQMWTPPELPEVVLALDTGRLDPKGRYGLTEAQAKAILDLKLHRLTGLERRDLLDDLTKLADLIAGLQTILASPEGVSSVIASELKEIRKRFATPRRTALGVAA